MVSVRPVTHIYDDPLNVLWSRLAGAVGLRIVRSTDVYASTDGRGTLSLGVAETLDRDDSLAQMVFHELCHALVAGPERWTEPDWGLDNASARDLASEHACLRVQAALAAPYGLRWFLAPTTEHRAFYDALDDAPLRGDGPVLELARRGRARADRHPFAPRLFETLSRTRQIARVIADSVPPERSLYARLEAPAEAHPSAPYSVTARTAASCGGCAFFAAGQCNKGLVEVRADDPACERWESELDCRRCGACCREAYGAVEIADDDPVLENHPELVERSSGRVTLRRVEERCGALEIRFRSPWDVRCRIYENRPTPCREFERGGEHCATARRRVGLSY